MSSDATSAAFSNWILEKLGFEGQLQRLRLGTTVVGRHSSSDIRIDSSFVSRSHAEITIEENKQIVVKDLNSQNGTYINDILNRSSTILLKHNDIIGFGAENDSEEISTRPLYILRYQPLPLEQPQVVDTIEIEDSDDDNKETLDVKPELPPPLMCVRRENIIAADNVLSIFGTVDDTIVKSLQKINPAVLEAVQKVANAETIDLSDEEIAPSQKLLLSSQNEVKNEKEKNTIIEHKITKMDTRRLSQSPNCFEGSRESDVDDAKINILEQEEDDSNDNMMFSQILLDEMKSEMEDDINSYHLNEKPDEEKDANYILNEENRLEASPISPIDVDSSSDVEEIDVDLNIKVSNWWNKLTVQSQTFPKMTLSQTIAKTDEYANNAFEQNSIPNEKENSLLQRLFKSLDESVDENVDEFAQESVPSENENQISQIFKPNDNKSSGETTPQLITPLESDSSEYEFFNDKFVEKRKKSEKKTHDQKTITKSEENIEFFSSPIKRLKKKKNLLRIESSSDESEKDFKIDLPIIITEKPIPAIKEQTTSDDTLKSLKDHDKKGKRHNRIEVISPPPMIKRRRCSRVEDLIKKQKLPTTHKKRHKSTTENKEKRKERLKGLSSKSECSKTTDISSKSLATVSIDEGKKKEIKEKKKEIKTAIKNTTVNRGAFLCEMQAIKPPIVLKKDPKKLNNISFNKKIIETKPPPASTNAIPEIEILKTLPQQETKDKIPISTELRTIYPQITSGNIVEQAVYSNYRREINHVIRKNAEVARARNAPKKLRFADVEKSFEEHERLKKRRLSLSATTATSLNELPTSSKSSVASATIALNSTALKSIEHPALDTTEISKNSIYKIPLLNGLKVQQKNNKKPKKTVRFNDNIEIRYFESTYEHTRKVDRKDIMPHIPYHQRREMIRQEFPIADRTQQIINQIIANSNEYILKNSLCKSNFQSLDNITSMPKVFQSFEHYQGIVLPLMKLEFVASLEKEMLSHAKTKPLCVDLKNIHDHKDCLVLETWFHGTRHHLFTQKKSDLVLLEIGERKVKVFAYIISCCKSTQAPGNKLSISKIFLKIISKSIEDDYLRSSKKLSIQIAMDNLQVTIGAYNAVYQLECSPLRNLLLNPAELLKSVDEITHEQNLQLDIPKEIMQNKEFNIEQKYSIKQIFRRICLNKSETTPNISLIQGPPGTGKSVVIVNLAMQILYGMDKKFHDKKILICAQSNCAIDSLALKLLQARWSIKDKLQRFRLVRFGIFERMDRNVRLISLKQMLDFERLTKINAQFKLNFKSVEKFENYLNSFEKEVEALKIACKSNALGLSQKLKAKSHELEFLKTSYNRSLSLEDERILCQRYFNKANIVCTTLSSCVKLSQYIDYFDACIVDEATQCTEPWTLLPLKFGINSLVLVGDSQQLPATVISPDAAKYGLSISLFTRIELCLTDEDAKLQKEIIYPLKMQYRMHPEICKFPNDFFYKNSLVNAPNTLQHVTPLVSYAVLNLTYAQNLNLSQGKIINDMEAEFVTELLKALNKYLPVSTNSYGIITPYAQHRKILADAVRATRLPHVTVQTIDSYQGLEKDVIIISNARTNGVGFLSNPQRLNVAITRPKKCLLLCGNFKNVQSVPAWHCLLNDANQRGFYHELGALDISDIRNKVIEPLLLRK